MIAGEQLCVVLVGTTQAENIGAVARAMSNMGVFDLRLAAPVADHLSKEARRMASHSEEILEQATVCDNLADAIADCDWVIGTSARRRDRLDSSFFLHELEANIPTNLKKGAIVFGRESNGLSNQELALCNYLLHIQTHGGHTSLNLAQAVMATLFEFSKLYDAEKPADMESSETRATSGEVEQLKEHWLEVLREVRFLKENQASTLQLSLSNLLGRNNLTEREVRMLRGFLHQTQLCLKNPSFTQPD